MLIILGWLQVVNSCVRILNGVYLFCGLVFDYRHLDEDALKVFIGLAAGHRLSINPKRPQNVVLCVL